jgi:hypothetical protein
LFASADLQSRGLRPAESGNVPAKALALPFPAELLS